MANSAAFKAHHDLQDIEVLGKSEKGYGEILTRDALRFIATLHRKFNPVRERLLERRKAVQKQIDSGILPGFLAETWNIRKSLWEVATPPRDLLDRRVEVTGPVDRKRMINAFNSGAKVFMADFEDAHSPTWKNTIEGQINLRDAVSGNLTFKAAEGKTYVLNPPHATLMVRPRGWHLHEKHVKIDGEPMSASLFDFGLFFFHNAKALIAKGSGPYFYIPKIENHLEARLWNDVFSFSEHELGVARGSIRATVLMETILAAFEMHEILFELKEHSAGLNCGRWDYIFSFIKKFRNHENVVFPDRGLVTMEKHFLRSYTDLLIQTAHSRGTHAMGGMAAQIPIKDDPIKNALAIQAVKEDKEREVHAGNDGTWVAHPGLVPIAMSVFDGIMREPNQFHRLRSDVDVTRDDLLRIPTGPITDAGLRKNVNIALLYLESWLRGNGAVALYHLMEDAATAEISRAQIWQWIRRGKVELRSFKRILADEYESNTQTGRRFDDAAKILDQLVSSDEFIEFLTLPAYEYLE